MIPETQVTCFRFCTIIFAQNVLLKTVKSNYTSVRFVIFGYMLLVFVPLSFWQIFISSSCMVFRIKNFRTWVFYTQN